MSLFPRCLFVVGTLVAAAGVPVRTAGQVSPPVFDTITYRDSGGFAGGGTGKSLSLSGDGRLEAQARGHARTAVQLQPGELADLCTAMAAVDWPHIEHTYLYPGAADLIIRDLVVVVRGNKYEIHADGLSKLPPVLQEIFDRLDAFYRRAAAAKH
jgi:hypothetical protein